MNSSATNKPIIIKFQLECYLGGGKVALGFGLYLVFMAKGSTHMVIMVKLLWLLQRVHFNWMQVIRTIIKPWMGSKFG